MKKGMRNSNVNLKAWRWIHTDDGHLKPYRGMILSHHLLRKTIHILISNGMGMQLNHFDVLMRLPQPLLFAIITIDTCTIQNRICI